MSTTENLCFDIDEVLFKENVLKYIKELVCMVKQKALPLDHYFVDRRSFSKDVDIFSLNPTSFISLIFLYKERFFQITFHQDLKLIYTSSDRFTIDRLNFQLELVDLVQSVIGARAIYHYNDPESLEQVKSDPETKPNVIYYMDEKTRKLKEYHYKIGEKNRIEE